MNSGVQPKWREIVQNTPLHHVFRTKIFVEKPRNKANHATSTYSTSHHQQPVLYANRGKLPARRVSYDTPLHCVSIVLFETYFSTYTCNTLNKCSK